SVRRMALEGEEPGKDVEQFFGPSKAPGEIKCAYCAIVAAWMLTFSDPLCSRG
ncbi:hypothetical protein EI94DRAFT_1572652, partial [Lactarius quietus]